MLHLLPVTTRHLSRRRLRTTALGLGATLFLGACASTTAPTSAPPASTDHPTPVAFQTVVPNSGKGMRVGYISANEAVPVNHEYTVGMQSAAKTAGMDLVVCDAKGQASGAIDCARQFSSLDLKAYFLYQLTVSAAASICEAGPKVPVIGLNFSQKPCEKVNIGVDNYQAGKLGGEKLGQYFKEKFDCKYDAYVSIELSLLGDANTQRMGGQRDGFSSVCGPITNFRSFEALTPAEARDRFRDLLSSLPTAQHIIVTGVADYAVLGAYTAAQAVSRQGQVFLSGQGLDSSAVCELAKNPQFVNSVAYFPQRLGEVAIPYLLKVLAGDPVEAPVLGTPIEVADASNVAKLADTSAC